MQHLEDFRRLYFHMCEYLGRKSGFSGGKGIAFMCVSIRIYKHMVCVGICRRGFKLLKIKLRNDNENRDGIRAISPKASYNKF